VLQGERSVVSKHARKDKNTHREPACSDSPVDALSIKYVVKEIYIIQRLLVMVSPRNCKAA